MLKLIKCHANDVLFCISCFVILILLLYKLNVGQNVNMRVLPRQEVKSTFAASNYQSMKKVGLLMAALVAMIGSGSCSKDCGHDFIEHDYTEDLVGTWSVIGPDAAEALVIKADGTMEFTAVHEDEYLETTARYEVVNNRMTVTWEDGTVVEGRLDVVAGSDFSLVIDEETGAGYYFSYCYEDLSDELVGSWLIQTGITSEVWTYHEDGTADCAASYYHLLEHYETSLTGTYKLVGDILFETYDYGGGVALSFGSRISCIPDGSPFGYVMEYTTLVMDGDELVENVMTTERVKKPSDLAGRKYSFADCKVANVSGADVDIEFMGYEFNFVKMDGSGLDVMLHTLFFNIEFEDADRIRYSYQYNNGTEIMEAPVVTEGNKLIVRMSEKVPSLKDVVFYTFQSEDCSQLHLCMDKVSFVNFYTNMQAMLMDGTDEQFDITDADSVNAIYDTINNAVETIKLTIEMTENIN